MHQYQWSLLNCFLFCVVLYEVESKNVDNERSLSRQKRYLVFPEGATLSIAFCMTAQTAIIPKGIFSEGINWGIAYDLPNNTKAFEDLSLADKFYVKRRHRRDLYGKIETVINSMGYDGRTCIFRLLCETTKFFTGTDENENLLERIIKIVFKYPLENMQHNEPHVNKLYHWASRKGNEIDKCSSIFSDCPFSLLDMAMGYYSAYGSLNKI